MKILRYVGKISELGKSTREKQKNLNVSEAFHLWNHLVQRYSVLHVTNTLGSFAKDEDFKLIIQIGQNTLNNHIDLLEKEMMKYGIQLPIRPPKQATDPADLELISDRHIFRRILRGIQGFLPVHAMALIHSTSPKIRDMFMTFMIEEIKLYDKFLEYGKIKEYVIKPPMYKI